MRKQFVTCETVEQALSICPWAAECVPVDGGYLCFESMRDADIYAAQA